MLWAALPVSREGNAVGLLASVCLSVGAISVSGGVRTEPALDHVEETS